MPEDWVLMGRTTGVSCEDMNFYPILTIGGKDLQFASRDSCRIIFWYLSSTLKCLYNRVMFNHTACDLQNKSLGYEKGK